MRTGFFLFFYHFGYYYKTKIEGKYKSNNLIYLMILVFIQLILLKINNKLYYNAYKMFFPESKVVITFVIATITGILFWLKIAEILEPITKNSKIINFIGSNTYDIMMHHLFWILLFNIFIWKISSIFSLTAFDVNKFKKNIYYLYCPGVQQFRIVYTFIGIAGPLTIRYLYIRFKEKIKNNNKFIKVLSIRKN